MTENEKQDTRPTAHEIDKAREEKHVLRREEDTKNAEVAKANAAWLWWAGLAGLTTAAVPWAISASAPETLAAVGKDGLGFLLFISTLFGVIGKAALAGSMGFARYASLVTARVKSEAEYLGLYKLYLNWFVEADGRQAKAEAECRGLRDNGAKAAHEHRAEVTALEDDNRRLRAELYEAGQRLARAEAGGPLYFNGLTQSDASRHVEVPISSGTGHLSINQVNNGR